MRLRNADVIVVQTNTMRALVHERFRRDAMVVPFLPNTTLPRRSGCRPGSVQRGIPLRRLGPTAQESSTAGAGVAHARRGRRAPALWLTLDPMRHGALVDEIEHTASVHGLQISNFGSVSRKQLDELYSKANALIYPLVLESYGLPLLEARAAGLPLITGELDYVRDIVDPEETFDPHSPLSMARAVKRFMGREEQRHAGTSAQEFLERLLSDDGR